MLPKFLNLKRCIKSYIMYTLITDLNIKLFVSVQKYTIISLKCFLDFLKILNYLKDTATKFDSHAVCINRKITPFPTFFKERIKFGNEPFFTLIQK